jgi:hypothetical protein
LVAVRGMARVEWVMATSSLVVKDARGGAEGGKGGDSAGQTARVVGTRGHNG